MSERSIYYSPSVVHVAMSRSSTPKVIALATYAYGIGPAGSYWGEYRHTNTAGNIAVTGVPLSPDYTLQFVAWGPYNGLLGEDPENAWNGSVTLTIVDPDIDPTDGVIQIYGPNGATIYVHTFVESGLVYDRFVDANGTLLKNHTPDTAPVGGIVGWHGTAADGKGEIQSNTYQIGGMSGNLYFARLYAGQHDSIITYADIKRITSGSADRPGLLLRCSAVAGYVDTALQYIRFWIYGNNDVAWFAYEQATYGGQPLVQVTDFASASWPRGTYRRMLARVNGDQLRLFIADAGGANPVLLATVTLATPWNDASHDYVGIAYTHVNTNEAYETFGTAQVSLLAEPAVGYISLKTPYGTTAVVGGQASIASNPDGFPVFDIEASVAYEDGSGWCAPTLASTTSPTQCTVACDPTGLALGVYHATVTFDSVDNDGPAVSVGVELEIYVAGQTASAASPGVSGGTGFAGPHGDAASAAEASASAGTGFAGPHGSIASSAASGVSAVVSLNYPYGFVEAIAPTYVGADGSRTRYWADVLLAANAVGVAAGADAADMSDAAVVAVEPIDAVYVTVTVREGAVTHTFADVVPWATSATYRLGLECRTCRRVLPFREPEGGGARTYFGFAIVQTIPTATSFTYSACSQPAEPELTTVPFVAVTALTSTTATVPFSGVVAVGQKVQLVLELAQHHVGLYVGPWKEDADPLYLAWTGVGGESVLSTTVR